jgi:surface antigen
MFLKLRTTMMLGASLIAVVACSPKTESTTTAGAVGGAIVGRASGGSLVTGAAVGGLLGYTAGRAMEEQDRRRMVYALETNQPQTWENPSTGYQYQMQPVRTIEQSGRECREFRIQAEVGSQAREDLHGTACRQADGSWELVSA